MVALTALLCAKQQLRRRLLMSLSTSLAGPAVATIPLLQLGSSGLASSAPWLSFV